MIATVATFFAGSKIGRYALIGAFIVGAVLLAMSRFRASAEKAGRLAEALSTSESTSEARERMNEVLAQPRSRSNSSRRLRNRTF